MLVSIFTALVNAIYNWTRSIEPVCAICSKIIDLTLNPTQCCGHLIHLGCVSMMNMRYRRCPICYEGVNTPYAAGRNNSDPTEIDPVEFYNRLISVLEAEIEMLRERLTLYTVQHHFFVIMRLPDTVIQLLLQLQVILAGVGPLTPTL